MMKNSNSPTKVVWTNGAITGVCVGILWGVSQLISQRVGPVMSLLLTTFTMVAFLLVGMLASKQTNRVRTGMLAGLVAGLTAGSIMWVVSLLEGEARLALFSLAIILAWILVFGTGMGMLGGQIVQITNAPEDSAKIVWTYGAIGGVCFNVIWFVASFLVGSIGSILAIVLTIVAFLLIGVLAAKQTGRVRTGTHAGLVAGLTGGGTIWVTLALASLMNGSIPIHKLINGLLDVSVLMALAFATVPLVVFLVSLGAGLGSLGGLIGKRKAKVPPTGDPMYSPCPPQQQIIQ